MFTETRLSTTPASALDVRINFEREIPATEDAPARVVIETVCRTFEPGDVHTLEDEAAEKLAADPSLGAHFTFRKVAEESATAAAKTTRRASAPSGAGE
jgi:hypothetical protein